MPQKTNINAFPYFDDYDSAKNFYKVLFRPGYSIQTRELTTLQSILQNQVESFGKFIFKQGQQVIPGEVGLNTRLDYVKLSSVSEVGVGNPDGTIEYKKYDIKKLIGSQLRGITSGVVANVVEAEYSTLTSSDTIYVNYVNSGDDNNEISFRQGETLEVVDGINTPLLVVGVNGSVLPVNIQSVDPLTGKVTTVPSPAMGYASAIDVQEGVYFVNGYFVRNEKQLLIIDKYYDKPSAKIGFIINEEIITPEEDSSLFDNAKGYSNSSAPGAHRLKINLELKKFDYNASLDKNFIQLLQINQGSIEKQVKPADYTLLEETLARRTYDESGDYVVNDFSFDIRDYTQTGSNNGYYKLDQKTNTVNGISPNEAESKMILSVGPGKAYVKGYEVVNKETKKLEIDKARDTLTRDNITLKSSGLSNFKITNVYGSVPLNTIGDEFTAYPDVYLNLLYNDGSIGLNGENSNYYKKTTNRRSTGFGLDFGIKTIYVQLLSEVPTQSTVYPSELWFIKTRNNFTASSADKVTVIATSLVRRKEVSESSSQYFVEFTVAGKKSFLDNYFIEYDEGSPAKRCQLYESQSDALSNDSNLIYGIIVDYNETITPVVGLAKPKDFSLEKRASGFNQDSDIVISKGRAGSNIRPYSATFNFSYFNPVFFTKIKLDNPPTTGFTSGKYVVGRTSKAYGVIESDSTLNYSYGRNLFVTTLSGSFAPGETILDEDGNAVKIAQENTISHFIVAFGGFGVNSTAKIVINGREIDRSVIDISSNGGVVYRADIINRTAFNETYSSPPIISVTPLPNDTDGYPRIIPVLNKNTVLTYNTQNIKSFYSKYSDYKFTADTDASSTEYATYTQISNFTFFGYEGRKYIECNGFGVNLSDDLIQGDIIQFTDIDNTVIKTIVQYVTDPEGINKSRIYLDISLPNDVVNATVIRVRSNVENINKSSLLFPTGSKQISSLVKDYTDSKFKYFIRKDFITDLTSGGGNITFSAQLTSGTQRFTTYNENNFVVTVLNKGSSTTVENGDIIYIDPRYVTINQSTSTSEEVTAGSFTITLPLDYFGVPSGGINPKLKLTATVEITKARPRLKTAIRNKRVVIISSGDRVLPIRGKDYDGNTLENLSYSDVYKLRYVYEGTSSSPPNIDSTGNLVSGTDVTYKYTFDDGQRDTFYDVSRIILKPGFEPSAGQLVVAFDYFEHSQGDFCTVDSYTHEAGVVASEIPYFNSSVYGTVSLKDVIDFRPKVDTKTTITGFQDVSILAQPEGRNYVNFVNAGGVICSTLASDKNLEYSLSFSETKYLDRIDGLFLDKKGNFVLKEGNSSLSPTKPTPLDDSIELCYLHIPAYTSSTKDVRIISVDNKRYTMKDIGKLEKRIERLEYYTTLSILEQQALNMQIKDEIGIERFKSGFIVDNFEAHSVGNLKSVDYKCSIDTQQSVLRPQVKENSIKLVEVNNNNDQRILSGYVNNNNIVTLPFNEVKLIGNSNATTKINPNPFVVIQYVGDISLSPTIDQWFDSSVSPLVVDSNTKLNSIFLAKNNPEEAYSSIYDSFVINWTGTNKLSLSISSLANINSEEVNSSTSQAFIASTSNISPQNNEIAKGVNTKNINNNVVSSALQFFVRSIPVKFVANRLKPNTRIYVFMEGRNIDRWVVPDTKYTGIPGNSLSTFGSPLITDSNGSVSGIVLIPAGKAPVENTRWTENLNEIAYDDSSEEIRFTEGSKTIRFTSSETDQIKDSVNSYAEVKYYASGIIPANPQSIVSTSTSLFKSNEGVQLVNSNTDLEVKPNPLSQTFKIENAPQGTFVTSVDLFFAKKSSSIPIRVYLSNMDTGKPGKYIIPGSESVLFPETYLKVYLTGDTNTITIKKDEFVTGKNTGASGPIYKVLDKNNIEIGDALSAQFELNTEQVYTLILKNHNGKTFSPNEPLLIPSVTEFNARNNKAASIVIAKNSGKVVDLKIKNTGTNYKNASIIIESPQLPGGSTASGFVDVYEGRIYNTEISLTGRGYTEAPSVIIKGSGTGSGGAVIESVIDIDTPAVIMGIASDDLLVGTTASITPTKFKFKHPIYLQNNSEYSLVVETDSIDYELWSSKLGETEITTNSAVTTQPSLGSLYKSQNTDNWTEDLFEDLKFTLYRAEFNTSRKAEVLLTNENLGYTQLDISPFETSVRSPVNATSPLFKNNNSIVKVNHFNNGFEDSGNSYVFFKRATDVGGVSSVVLNNQLFTVTNGGVDYYNIVSPIRAGENIIGGGSSVLASYNVKFEKLYAQVPYIQVGNTSIETFIKTTNIVPIDSNTKNYTSYSQTDYEKTFINQQENFLNQKVIASRVNQTYNSLERSLTYKLILSSDDPFVSPVIDLNTSSLKTSTNRVENSTGYEDRYGKRNQILRFLPLYNISLSISGDVNLIEENQTIKGVSSQAEGTIVEFDGATALIKLRTKTPFIQNEDVMIYATNGEAIENIDVIASEINDVPFDFSENSNIIAYYPQNVTIDYNNKINGKVLVWDAKEKELIVENCYSPIQNNYFSPITLGSAFSREEDPDVQLPDIFRVGDVLRTANGKYVEINEMEFTTGVDYVSDLESKNSSSLAKYVTKEVFIQNPGTSIDVRITANVKDTNNIKIYYKTKKVSTQNNFEDLNWIPFNTDGNPDVNSIANVSVPVTADYEKQSYYQEFSYSTKNLSEFSSFAVKIIMKTDDPTYVPKIQDFRAVASY